MACQTVYVVSEDAAAAAALAHTVETAGIRTESLPSLESWLASAGLAPEGCLVLDAAAGELVGPDRLARLASACSRLPVLVLIGKGDISAAVSAIRAGAADVLQKPLRNGNLLEHIRRAMAASPGMARTAGP